jgi:hypothetical protein
MNSSSKITKSQLKKIVKECLVEILNEGLSGALVSSEVETTVPKNVSERAQKRPSDALATAIKAEARGNPVMAQIFADTAKNSLPKMLSERSDSISDQEQFYGTPEEAFGEDVSSKWANLAFSPISKNKK